MEIQKRELVVEDVKGNREVAYALLTAHHPLFVTQKVAEEESRLIIESELTEELYDWSLLEGMNAQEKLRHLLNIGELYSDLEDSIYTYELSPDSLVFSRNAEPRFIFRGIKEQLPPYEAVTDTAFLTSFKAMIVSLMDKKATYDQLMAGKLPFYKGNLFCESIVQTESLQEVQELLLEKYNIEKQDITENFSLIRNKYISRLKSITALASIATVVSLAGILYFLLFAMPRQEMISSLRLAFINKDYSRVVTVIKDADSKSLSQDDKFISAYSVIMTEPLTEEQKSELSKISTQSNEDYLRYWILIGQAKIDEAMDIASYLDDPQLMMYGLTKKIDEVQRDSELSAEKRTEQLNSYKSKLEELKKTYLTPETDTQALTESE